MVRRASEMQVEVRENMRGGVGKVSVQHYFKKDEITAKTRLCAKLTLPPGAGIGPHAHEGEDELFIVLRGRGLLEEGPARTQVGPGDAILTGKGGTHAIRNEGPEPLELAAVIMTYA